MKNCKLLLIFPLFMVTHCKTTQKQNQNPENSTGGNGQVNNQGSDSLKGNQANGNKFGATGTLANYQPKNGLVTLTGWCNSSRSKMEVNLLSDGSYTGTLGNGDFAFAGEVLSFSSDNRVLAKCFVKDTRFSEVYPNAFFEDANLTPVNPGSSIQCDALNVINNPWSCQQSFSNRNCEFTFSCHATPGSGPGTEVRP